MAVAFVQSLGALKTTTGASSYAFTPTATPSAGNVVLVAVVSRKTSLVVDPTSVTQTGMTFTKVNGAAEAGAVLNVSVWSGIQTGTVSGNITVSFGATAQTMCAVMISEWSGVDTTTPVTQSITGTATAATALSLTLGATPTSGMIYGFHAHRAATLSTEGSGFTEISDDSTASPANTGWESEYKAANQTTVDWTTYTTSSNSVGVGLELKAAGGATQAITPNAITSGEALGQPTISSTRDTAPKAIASAEKVGYPRTKLMHPLVVSGGKITRRSDGSRFVVRGLNMYGVEPYAGGGTDIRDWLAAGSNFANVLAEWTSKGVNVVRLPVKYDTSASYLADIKNFVDRLAAAGIYTLIVPFTDGDVAGTANFGYWPTQGSTNDTSTRAANFLVTVFQTCNYSPWILMDNINEPTNDSTGSGGALTDANWASGHINANAILRAGGYDGPIFNAGNGWAWSLPATQAATIIAADTNVVFECHRYQFDGSSSLSSTDPSTTWKTAWPDVAAANGWAAMVGEYGPYNGGYGTTSRATALSGWCTSMRDEIVKQTAAGKLQGGLGWTWVWNDEYPTDPGGNSMVNGWGVVTGGGTSWSIDTWGTIVYAMTTALADLVYPNSIKSSEAVGFPTVAIAAAPQNVAPVGIKSAEALGVPTLASTYGLSATGVASGEQVGAHVLSATYALAPTGVSSSEAVGQASVSSTYALTASAVRSGEAVGSPSVSPGAVATAAVGIASSESFGFPAVALAGGLTQNIAPLGVASSEVVGAPAVAPGAAPIAATSVPSGEAFGLAVVTPGAVNIAPVGIDASAGVGAPALTHGLTLTSVRSGEAVGNPTVAPGAVSITPLAITTSERVGNPTVLADQRIFAVGIPSSEALGKPAVMGLSAATVYALAAMVPARVPTGEATQFRIQCMGDDATAVPLAANPFVWVYTVDSSGTQTLLASGTATTLDADTYGFTWTPASNGTAIVQVRGVLGATVMTQTWTVTSMPRFDPIALATEDILVSRF